ncbi:MAG: hypothetical protein IKR17_05655 [Bacteroidales bacterium]|nr:hypothetical protein [Bacteroidales bacterium]
MLQLSLRDVWLDFFKSHKRQILQLRCGQHLFYADGYLCLPTTKERIASLSNKCRAELSDWQVKGYNVRSASISYIVAWRGQDDAEESAVILPELVLSKV